MSNKKFKENIRNAFIEETPNNLDDIKAKCVNIEQTNSSYMVAAKGNKMSYFKRLIFPLALATILIFGIIIGNNIEFNDNKHLMSVYLDVNPSIELKLNEEEKIYDYNALNEDAEIVLSGLSLKNISIDEGLNAIVSSMYVNGYLTESANSILISVDNDSDTELLNNLANEVNEIFERRDDMNCSIIAQHIKPNDDIRKKAKENNISIGKAHLIDKIIESNNMYEENDNDYLYDLSIKELNLLYRTEMIDKPLPPSGDIMIGKPEGFVDKEMALATILSYLDVTYLDIESYRVTAMPQYNHNDMKIIYLITIEFTDGSIERYAIDCVTGGLLSNNPFGENQERE